MIDEIELSLRVPDLSAIEAAFAEMESEAFRKSVEKAKGLIKTGLAPAFMAASSAGKAGAAGALGSAGAAIGGAAAGAIGKIPGIEGISAAFGAGTEGVGGVSDVFSGLMGSLGGFLGIITGLVASFDPSLVEELAMAFSDIVAVLGEALSPVLQAIIPVVQAFGDLVLALMPALDPVIKIMIWLADIVRKVIQGFTKLLSIWPFSLIFGSGGGTSRGKSQKGHGTGKVGISEFGSQLHAAGFARPGAISPELKAMQEIAKNTAQTATNTRPQKTTANEGNA